jgi:hypothetical protein
MRVKSEEIWKAFAETGEPALYLLYRAMCGKTLSVKETAMK